MHGINSSSPNVPEYRNSEMKDKQLQTMQQTAFSSRERQNMDLEIVTSEGDVVTLSSNTESNMDYMSYDKTGSNNGGSYKIHGEALSIEVSSGFSLSVNGDLNEEELEEIQMLINDVDSVMGSMVSGNMNDAVEQAMKIGGFDTISGFEAELSMEKTTMFRHQASVAQTQLNDNTSQYANMDKPKNLSGPEASMKNLLDKMMEKIEESTIEPAKLANPLMDSINQLFGKINSLEMMHQGMMERVGKLMEGMENLIGTVA